MGVRESSPGRGYTTVDNTSVYTRLSALEKEVGTTQVLSGLQTTNKASIVDAVNEVWSDSQSNAASLASIALNVMNYGAKGDGTTDDTTAINSAISAANALVATNKMPILYFPYSAGYLVTSPITIPPNIQVTMEAPIIYNGTRTGVALTVGSQTAYNYRVKLKLAILSQTASDWSDSTYTGIQVLNAYSARMEIARVEGFYVGVEFMASQNLGLTMNETELGYFRNCQTSLQVSSITSGWPNGNRFSGGVFLDPVGGNVGKASTSVKIISKDGGYTNINANNFYNPRFEAQTANIPITIVHGLNNNFFNIRAENNSTSALMICQNSANNNIVTGWVTSGYGSTVVQNYSSYTGNYYLPSGIQDKRLIFDSKNLGQRATYYSPTQLQIQGIAFAYYYDTNVYDFSPAVGGALSVIPNGNGVALGSGSAALGIYIDTTNSKDFLVVPEYTDNPPRLLIICYDGSGNILSGNGLAVSTTDGWGFNQYVKDTLFAPYTGFGNCYRSGSPASSYHFIVHPSVKKVRVMLTMNGGTGLTTTVEGFKIYSLDGNAAHAYTGGNYNEADGYIVNAIPTIGTWKKGKRVYLDSVAPSGNVGWVCTTAGTANNTAWVTGTAYTVGQQVNNGGNVYQCITAGTSGATAPTGTGTSISDGGATWQYINPLAVFKTFGTISA